MYIHIFYDVVASFYVVLFLTIVVSLLSIQYAHNVNRISAFMIMLHHDPMPIVNCIVK